MANAGTVNINLVAETAQFVANINKAVNTLKYLKAAEIAFDKGKELAGWMSQQIQLAKEYSKAGTAVADALDRQAQSLGTTARAMAAFAVVEHRADLEAGSLAASLSKMQQAIADSQAYGSSADKTFAKLGLRFSDLIALSAEDQFRMIADAISKVDTASERTAYTMDIFGKAGKGLVGTMAEGSKAFDSAAEAAKRFGLALSATEQARILKAEEKVKELALVIKGYQQQVAAANAESVAASAAMSAKLEEDSAKSAKSISSTIGWLDRLIAAWYDTSKAGTFTSAGPMSVGLESGKKLSMELGTAMQGAALEVRKAGQEAQRTQNLNEGMLKVFVDYERQFNAAGQSARAAISRDAEITKKQAEMTKDLSKERMEWLKPTVDAYQGMQKFWNSWYDDMAKARKAASEKSFSTSGFDFVRGEYDAELKKLEEYRKKSAADDPRVKDAVARRQLGGDKGANPAIRDELMRIQQERIAIDQAMGDPSQDPRALYQRKVNLLLKEEAIRTAEEERRRVEMENQEKRALYSDFFGNLSTIAGAFADQSREMFMASKVASIAQAEINAWMAYSNILAKESLLGGTTAHIMAGVALAAGQVAVMNIAQQQPPGRKNGGAVMRNSLYEVAEKGPEILQQNGKSYLLPGDSSGRVQPMGPGGGGRVVVNVNNLPGQTAQVREGGTPDNPSITIDIIDGMMAAAASQPRSQFNRSMQSRFGLNAARGAG